MGKNSRKKRKFQEIASASVISIAPEDGRNKKRALNRSIVHLLCIAAIALIAYANSFKSPFQWDEYDFIVQNPIIQNLDYFLNPSKAKTLDPDYYIFLKTRYISYLTFALNYRIHGFDVFGYHVFNILIHILNALLVYGITTLTLRTSFLKDSFLRHDEKTLSLFSALLFAIHPLQTEAVTYIFQRHASFVTFFYLLTLFFYIQWRSSLQGTGISPIYKGALYGLSLLSALLAMKTKENAFTLPVILILFELFFLDGPIKIRLIRLIPFFLTPILIPLSIVGMENPVEKVINHALDPASMLTPGIPKEVYLFTQFRVLITYLRLLFLPINQNLDYEYPLFKTFWEPQVLLSLAFHISILGLAVYLFVQSRSRAPELRILSFGILWFYITHSIESSIIPLQMIICEYRVYLPSVGIFLSVVTGLFFLWRKLTKEASKSLSGAILILSFSVVLLTILTYSRNALWTDSVRLWEDVTRKSPSNPRGHYNLGLAYGKEGRLDEAAREFQTTLTLNPRHANAYNNLGLVYERQGRIDEAVRAIEAALELEPNSANFYYNLGVVLGRKGRIDEAVKAFQTTLRLHPHDANAYNNLGVMLLKQGRIGEAVHAFKMALQINPNHVNARNNLMRLQEMM